MPHQLEVKHYGSRLLGAATLAAVASVAVGTPAPAAHAAPHGGFATFTDGSGTPAGPMSPGPFSSPELAGALLSAAEAAGVTGTRAPMQLRGPVSAFLDTAKDTNDTHCASPWGPAEAS